MTRGDLFIVSSPSGGGKTTLIRRLLANPPGGWTSVMASVWLLGGLIIAFIGVIGIYLSKVFSETKRRPYTIVRQIYGSPRNKISEWIAAEEWPHACR